MIELQKKPLQILALEKVTMCTKKSCISPLKLSTNLPSISVVTPENRSESVLLCKTIFAKGIDVDFVSVTVPFITF